MSFVDEILKIGRRDTHARAWPVGKGEVSTWERDTGHDDSLFSPPEYGDYLATSNEIYSVAAMRARLVSGLDLNLFAGRGVEKRSMASHPATALLRYVNPHFTWRRLERLDELSMCIWGESFWAVERDRGRPKEIWWLKPSQVFPAPDQSDYLAGFWYEPSMGGQRLWFGANEVVWYRYPNPLDQFSPLSPLAAARLAADTGKAMMQANGAAFQNGLQLAGLIVPPGDRVTFSETQADELERRLEKRFTGPQNAKKWAVLRYEAEFRPMSVTPKDAEFLGGLNMSLRQVCNAYGIPSSLLNDIEHSNMAILEELVQAMWAHTLIPDTKLRAAEIEEQFLPKFGRGAPDYAAYDYETVPALQKARSEAWDREAQAVDRGLLTPNEWRLGQGMPPVKWGDVWWAPANKFAVTDAGSKPAAPPGTPGVPDMPDDERNPANQPPAPRGLDHNGAREFLASLRLNGYAGAHGAR